MIGVNTPVGLPGLTSTDPSWRWVPSGTLPEGLRFDVAPTDITRAAITGIPTDATSGKSYELSFRFECTNPDLIIGEAKSVTFTIFIHPRIEFDQAATSIPDGMVGPGPNAPPPPPVVVSETPAISWSVQQPEPPEVYKEATIAAEETRIPGGTTAVEWITNASQLPDSKLAYSSSGARLFIKGETTDMAKAGDTKLSIGFSISHPNPNINGAEENKEHTIRIWNRAYLTVIIEPRRNNPIPAQVSRANVLEKLEDFGRAIMPGETGRVLAGQTASGFVRWEVSNPTSLAGIPPYPEAYPPAGSWTGIDKWGLSPPGAEATSWMEIRMPMPASPSAPAINVEITGFHIGPPLIEYTLPNGTLDVPYPGTFRITNLSAAPSVIGTGPVSRTWEILLEANESFPPGVQIDSGAGVLFGTPTATGTFTFHVVLTLPGTMRLTYGPYSIFVDRFRPNYGDVDGSGSLDLADLVLLAKFLNGDPMEKDDARALMELKNSMRNGNIASADGTDPDGRDLNELARWFALQGEYDDFITSRPTR